MAFSTKYELEETSYGMGGWNAIAWANMQLIDNHVHTRLAGTAGEAVAQYEAGYLASDGKYYLAKADGSLQPAVGIFIEAAAADAAVRLQRVGPITNGSWSWTVGGMVYLSATTPGALSQIASNQCIGIALSATSILLSSDWQQVEGISKRIVCYNNEVVCYNNEVVTN